MGGNSYPFGPHGPQGGPHQVTPNPTPAWVPPPPMASPGPFVPQASGPYAGGGGASTSYPVNYTPGPKRYWLALLLAAIFGPLGLFYASKKGALLLLVLLFAVPYTMASMGVWPAFHRHPLYVLANDGVMDRMWRLCVMASLVWCVFGVRRYNMAFKAAK